MKRGRTKLQRRQFWERAMIRNHNRLMVALNEVEAIRRMGARIQTQLQAVRSDQGLCPACGESHQDTTSPCLFLVVRGKNMGAA